MSPVLSSRKRVTKAGRGAHAIYLPKAWIDAWAPGQAERSEVDLISLDEHLILSPVVPGVHADAHFDSDDPELLNRLVLSAYVSGHGTFRIRKAGHFTDTQIIEARRALRLLDERIEVEWHDHELTFRRSPEERALDLTRHLHDLTGTVIETAEGLAELLEFYPHNPSRVLHAVHLLSAIEREDLQRVKNQAYRSVSRFQVPAARVADLTLLLLVTHTLARMGKLIVEAACTVSDHLGVPRDRLHYPPELLEEHVQAIKVGPAFRSILDQARSDLGLFVRGLKKAQALFHVPEGPGTRATSGSKSIDGLAAVHLALEAFRDHAKVAESLMNQMEKVWDHGLTDEDPKAIYRIIKVHVHVQDLMEELRTLGDRVTDFRLAETMEEQAPKAGAST